MCGCYLKRGRSGARTGAVHCWSSWGDLRRCNYRAELRVWGKAGHLKMTMLRGRFTSFNSPVLSLWDWNSYFLFLFAKCVYITSLPLILCCLETNKIWNRVHMLTEPCIRCSLWLLYIFWITWCRSNYRIRWAPGFVFSHQPGDTSLFIYHLLSNCVLIPSSSTCAKNKKIKGQELKRPFLFARGGRPSCGGESREEIKIVKKIFTISLFTL